MFRASVLSIRLQILTFQLASKFRHRSAQRRGARALRSAARHRSGALLLVRRHSATLLTTGLRGPSADRPSIIIGGGRVSSMLQEFGCAGDVLIERPGSKPWPAAPLSGPIYVCSNLCVATNLPRCTQLAAVVDATPCERRGDLVFLQNAMLDTFLAQRDLNRATQAVLYLRANGKSAVDIADSEDTALPSTCATGQWAEAFAARLAKGDLSCSVCAAPEFASAMLEKHVSICVHNLVGQLHGGLSVGEVGAAKYETERRELYDELLTVGAASLNVRPLEAGSRRVQIHIQASLLPCVGAGVWLMEGPQDYN